MTRRVSCLVLSLLTIGGLSAVSCHGNKTSASHARSQEETPADPEPPTILLAQEAGEHQYIVSRNAEQPLNGTVGVVDGGSDRPAESTEETMSFDVEMIFDGPMPDDWNHANHSSHTVTINGEVVEDFNLDTQLPPQVREALKQQGTETYRELVEDAMASSDHENQHVEMLIDVYNDEEINASVDHADASHHDDFMWRRIEEGEVKMAFLENEALVTLWAIDVMKRHVEPVSRVDMVRKLLDMTQDQNQMKWQRACRNAMLMTLMETQVEMGNIPDANTTLMSIIEENMNGSRSKNTTEQE